MPMDTTDFEKEAELNAIYQSQTEIPVLHKLLGISAFDLACDENDTEMKEQLVAEFLVYGEVVSVERPTKD